MKMKSLISMPSLPAFPTPQTREYTVPGQAFEDGFGGMSLRMYAALQVLPAIYSDEMSRIGAISYSSMAREAFVMADAMIEAENSTKTTK